MSQRKDGEGKGDDKPKVAAPAYDWPKKEKGEGKCPCCPADGPAKCSIRVRWQKKFDDEYEGNPTDEEKDAYDFSATGNKDTDTEFFAQVFAVVDIVGLPANQLKNCHLVQDVIVQKKRVGDAKHTTEGNDPGKKHDYSPTDSANNKAYRGSSLKDWPGITNPRDKDEFKKQFEWYFFLARDYILECPDIEYYWGYQMKVDWSGDKPKIQNKDDISKVRFQSPTAPPNPYLP